MAACAGVATERCSGWEGRTHLVSEYLILRLADVLEVLETLQGEDGRYAVFGALSLAAHGLDRATRDLDLFVAPDMLELGGMGVSVPVAAESLVDPYQAGGYAGS